MNSLSELFLDIKDGEYITLDKDCVYDVRQDDSFEITGYFCSNTAKQDENPDGRRFSAIYIKDKKNIVIDGNGATILVHGKMTPILLADCENITVKNLTVDYAVPTMTEFTVSENDCGVITIKINDDCLWRVDGNSLYWCGEKGLDGKPYWENASDAPKRYVKVLNPQNEFTRDFSRNDLSFEKIEIIGENTLKCTLVNKDADLSKGDIVQTRNITRDQVGSFFQRCKKLTFSNLRVKFMHGLGMVSQFCENVTFRDCDFTPKEGRTIASTADFFQFSGCRGRLIIENCKAGGAQDDYVNVHGTHLRIIECDRNNSTLTVRFMHPESWGFQAFTEGDNIEFIRWDTLQPYWGTEVIEFRRLNNTDILLYVKDIPDDILLEKDVVENVTWTPDVYVRGCEFGATSGRGILCTTRGEVIIENNRFYKLWGPALLIEDDCNFWFESGLTRNIVFRNNCVITCSFNREPDHASVIQCTPKVMNEDFDGFVHKKLHITGNRFLEPRYGKYIFYLEYLENVIAENNEFDMPFEIVTRKCGKTLQNNNFIK